MVTTNRQLLEKHAGRKLTNKEFEKLNKKTHIEAMKDAESIAINEGRKPGYKKRFIKGVCK